MKKVMGFLLIVFLLGLSGAFAEEKLTVSQQASQVNIFNRITDSMAASGKSKVQQQQILEQRKEQRRLQRLRDIERKRREEKQKEQKKLELEQRSKLRNIQGWR